MRAHFPAPALRRFAALLVAAVCAFTAVGQDDILNVAGLVTDEADRKKLAGVEVSVTRDGAPFDALTTDAKGAYDFQLPLRHDYVFSFTYPGYGVKRIRVDGSKVPPEDLKGGFRLDMPMSLFKLVDGFNPAILEDYYGKASFDPVKNTIAFDFSHTERMRNKVKAEFDRVARMAGDLAKMREDFAALLAKGKSAMTASKWDQALSDFTAALAIFPDDKEAQQFQAQAQAKVDEQQSAAQAEKKFQDALKAAEADLKVDMLDSAAERFRGAQALKPAAPEPADGLKRVEARRTALAADENYRKAIADADAHFTAGRYADASKGYAAASTMKPGEVYPKTRKADADRLLADAAAQAAALAEKTARYETLVAAADKAFKAKSYKEAKGSYEEAARILPAEKYPQERIALCTAEIEKEAAAAAAAASASASAAAAAAAAAELDAKYTAQISAGDAAFAKSDWVAAKAAYRKALELKPA
jgi:tetratricopeptide (TPR) repeat protein